MPGTVLDAGHRLLIKADKILSSWSFLVGEQDIVEASNFRYNKYQFEKLQGAFSW